MKGQTAFEQKQLRGLSFEVGQPARFRNLCKLAESFADWCEAKVSSVREKPTEITVNQVSLLLQDQFLARLDSAPRAHRTFGSAHHTCLIGVYVEYGQELRELRWQVSPPLVRDLPAPAAPPNYEIAGVPFGIKK